MNSPLAIAPSTPVISAQNLNHYFGEGDLRKQALFDINLDIHAGEIIIMTGRFWLRQNYPSDAYGWFAIGTGR